MSLLPPLPPPAIQYATPPRSSRTGILVVVGIISIVIGSLGVLWNLSSAVVGAVQLATIDDNSQPRTTVTTSNRGSIHTTVVVTSSNATTGNSIRLRNRMILDIVGAILGLGTAGLLTFAGLALLLKWPSAFRMHCIYLAIKILLIACVMLASFWIYSGWGRSPQPARASFTIVIDAFFSAGLSLLYPIALVVIFSTRMWKEAFESLALGKSK